MHRPCTEGGEVNGLTPSLPRYNYNCPDIQGVKTSEWLLLFSAEGRVRSVKCGQVHETGASTGTFGAASPQKEHLLHPLFIPLCLNGAIQ